jgi:hypothetical protein
MTSVPLLSGERMVLDPPEECPICRVSQSEFQITCIPDNGVPHRVCSACYPLLASCPFDRTPLGVVVMEMPVEDSSQRQRPIRQVENLGIGILGVLGFVVVVGMNGIDPRVEIPAAVACSLVSSYCFFQFTRSLFCHRN